MNEEQVKSAIRWIVATFGGMISGWFVAKGWFSVDQILSVLNSGTFIGMITSGVMLIWGIITHKQANAVAIVDRMPEVAGVVTKSTTEGRALAKEVPSDTVVTAGTAAAAAVSKVSSAAL